MVQSSQAQPLQLNPPGPYEMRVAVELRGVKVATAESPARLCLGLEDGCELHIPLRSGVVEKLRLALEDYPEHPDISEIGE